MQNIGGKQFSNENSWTRSFATDAPYRDETVSCFSFRGTKAWGSCSYGMLVAVSHFPDSLSVPSLHMGPIGCLGTSVNKCQLASRNVSEEWRPQLHGYRSLKTRTEFFVRHTHEQNFSSAALVGGGTGFFPAESLCMAAPVNKNWCVPQDCTSSPEMWEWPQHFLRRA